MIATVATEPAYRLTGPALLRQAHRNDVPAIQRVRHSVRENRLVSQTISDDDVIAAIEVSGRGWVIEVDHAIVGFAIGNAVDGNVWALFIDPAHEGCGHGHRLHDAMVEWMKSQGVRTLWLTTEPGTRAQAFYERAGWSNRGLQPSGELRFELDTSVRLAGYSGGERG